MYCEEIRPYWLAVTKGYGFTVDDIDWSCPADLEPYAKAHNEEIKERDKLNWYLGQYFVFALDCTVCNSTLWRKKGSKLHEYIEKPILQMIEEQNKPLSEKELQRQRELFVAKLEVMKTNFELNHKGGKGS